MTIETSGLQPVLVRRSRRLGYPLVWVILAAAVALLAMDRPAQARRCRYRVLVVGDSISAGSRSYAHRLAAYCSTAVVARNGASTDWMLEQVSRTNLTAYTHLIVLGGVNDINRDMTLQASRNLYQIYRLGRRAGLRVIAVTISPWMGWPSWTPLKHLQTLRLNSWLRAVRQRRIVDRLIDFYRIAADRSDGRRLTSAFDSPDHLHPNGRAHRYLLAWSYWALR